MNLRNTTTRQDREISEAESSPHIPNLVSIIHYLDQQLTEWKKTAQLLNCDSPDELRHRIKQMEEAS